MIGAMDPAEQPITLVPSRGDEWSRRFTVMAETVRDAVPEAAVEHIGSTAVPGLAAKDVVDLLVGVAADDVVHVARLLAAAGFDLEGEHGHHCWLSSPGRHDRDAVVHVVVHDSRSWHNRVAFRDLLRDDEDARRAYLEAKESAATSARDWDEYTRAKTSIVMELLARRPLAESAGRDAVR